MFDPQHLDTAVHGAGAAKAGMGAIGMVTKIQEKAQEYPLVSALSAAGVLLLTFILWVNSEIHASEERLQAFISKEIKEYSESAMINFKLFKESIDQRFEAEHESVNYRLKSQLEMLRQHEQRINRMEREK